jgi:hypothetical protein
VFLFLFLSFIIITLVLRISSCASYGFYKPSLTPCCFVEIEDEFHALAKIKVSEVKEYEWGTNVSKENLNHGYNHCFLLTFANEKDRDVYIEHKDHVAFVELLKPHMDSATVIDYWANN